MRAPRLCYTLVVVPRLACVPRCRPGCVPWRLLLQQQPDIVPATGHLPSVLHPLRLRWQLPRLSVSLSCKGIVRLQCSTTGRGLFSAGVQRRRRHKRHLPWRFMRLFLRPVPRPSDVPTHGCHRGQVFRRLVRCYGRSLCQDAVLLQGQDPLPRRLVRDRRGLVRNSALLPGLHASAVPLPDQPLCKEG